MKLDIKGIWRHFKISPVDAFASWQDQRFVWIILGLTGLLLEQVAYQIFQKWLYMNPCEQCVYIRFSMLSFLIAAIVGGIKPKNIAMKITAYAIAFYGAIKGMLFSIKLNSIHHAVHSDDIFGVQGCSAVPTFPFNLPLHEWFPSTFLPTGDCGYDNPIIPDGTVLNSAQIFLTNIYSDGWYLIPSSKFMNMAQAMMIAFVVILTLLTVMFVAWIIRDVKQCKNRKLASKQDKN